jgi:transcriptional regulator with XRE-family HTH domain
MKLQKTIGRKIKEARESVNLSQQALSEKTGYGRDKISRMENGKQNLTILTLEKIADALDKRIVIDLM